MSATLPLDVGAESRVLLVPRHGGEYASVGTVAEVTEVGRLPGGAGVATLEGLHRAVIGAAEAGADGRLYVEVEERPDDTPLPEVGRLPGGAGVATLEGLHRAVIGAAEAGADGRLYVEVEERPDDTPPP